LYSLKKIFYTIIILFATVLVGSSIAVFVYKDRIIDLLKTEIDQKISTKIEVGSIDLKLIKGFPNISIQFIGVKFHSTFSDELLLESKKIYFVLNIIDLFNKSITVERLEIENAKLIIHKNGEGEKGYDVFKVENSGDDTGNMNINSIKFSNVEIVHLDDERGVNDVFDIISLNGLASFNDSVYQINIRSKAIIKATNNGYLAWAVDKEIRLETRASYDGSSISIKQGKLFIESSQFNFNGDLGLMDKMKISLHLSGSELKFLEITGLFKMNIQERLNKFDAKGLIKFDANLEGDYSDANWPSFNANFSLNEFQINNPEFKYPIENIHVIGDVAIPNIKDLTFARLDIKKMSGELNDKVIKVNGSIVNFEKPIITCTLLGDVDVSWALSLANFDQDYFKGTAEGILSLDLKTSANFSSKNEVFEMEDYVVDGTIGFNKLGIDSLFNLPLRNMNGELLMSKEKIELTNVSGSYGESDIAIVGSILLNTKQRIFDTDVALKSNFLNLDEIVNIITELPADTVVKPIQIRFKVNTRVELDVNHLNFKKFKGDNFKAELLINETGVIIKRAASRGMGGSIVLTGSITSQFNNDIYVEAKVRTQKVDLDSLFYIFNNFDQQFITADVIKGNLFSEVYTSMYFDKDWTFKRNLLYAEGLLNVKKGELNNFEPIMSLSPYLKNEDENLSQMRFSDLESSIIISSDTVFISDMYIGSNVRNIKIGGYHTLLQQIDYRLSVPIINNKLDKDNEFGAIKEDKEGKLSMPFRITGTTTDYKVKYDITKASSNLVKGIKKEIKELGNTLMMKQSVESKTDTLVLEDDDFFDWDNE